MTGLPAWCTVLVGGGKIPTRKLVTTVAERTDGPIENTPTASDNSYPASYTSEQAAELFDRTPTRIGQVARTWGIGEKFGRLWKFTFEDLILLEKHLRRGKLMRDVTPKAVESAGSGPKDALLPYLRAQLNRLRQDGFRTLNDVWCGVNNRVTKEVERLERRIASLEEKVSKLDGGSGRGVSCFGGPALPTLDTYAAEAA